MEVGLAPVIITLSCFADLNFVAMQPLGLWIRGPGHQVGHLHQGTMKSSTEYLLKLSWLLTIVHGQLLKPNMTK